MFTEGATTDPRRDQIPGMTSRIPEPLAKLPFAPAVNGSASLPRTLRRLRRGH